MIETSGLRQKMRIFMLFKKCLGFKLLSLQLFF